MDTDSHQHEVLNYKVVLNGFRFPFSVFSSCIQVTWTSEKESEVSTVFFYTMLTA